MAYRDDPDGETFFALRTFRRDGAGVSTPIWLAAHDDRFYACTPSRSGKVRRLRNDPRVEFAPSDFHGTPHGEWRSGRARIVPASRKIRRVMRAKYGRRFVVFTVVTWLGRGRAAGGPPIALEITPA